MTSRTRPFVALCLLLTVACTGTTGASSPEAAADAHLAALSAHDPNALQQTVPQDFDSDRAISEKLDKYAGVDVAALRREYVPHDVTPNIVNVLITAEGSTFEDSIHVQRVGRTWYVMLGRLRGFSPGPTSQIRPPPP